MAAPLSIGQQASITRAFSPEDILTFARLSGDGNPLHLDPEYARGTPFGAPIVHGLLVSSLFSQLLAEQLTGPGTIYLSQRLTFRSPAYIGEDGTATVEVIAVRLYKPIITLRTWAVTVRGTAIDGEAVVRAPYSAG